MKKWVCGLMAAVMLMSTTAFAAEAANTSGKQYYLDLEMVDDKTFTESSVDLVLNINGEETILYKDGRTQKPDGTIVNEADLSSAILFDYRPNGKLDEASMPITFVPIRRIAQALSGYGVRIDWDSENAVVVLDTPAHGRIQFPIGATSIEANGTTYEETTYRFPVRPGQSVGDPINIVSSRQSRTYVTVRFLSNLLIDNCTFSWNWKGTERLTVTGTMEKGSGVEKTYGLNKNYLSEDGIGIRLDKLPHLTKTLEDTGLPSDLKDPNGSYEVWYDILDLETKDINGISNRLHVNATTKWGLDISGYDSLGDDETQTKVIEAMLTDLICDADKDAIMALLKEISVNLSEGYTPKDGITTKAQTYLDNLTTEYEFSEVILKFVKDEYGRLSQFIIKDK